MAITSLHPWVSVADSYTDVASKISEVVSSFDITSDEIKFLKVIPFGTKFLILFVWTGPAEYGLSTLSGFVSKMVKDISKSALISASGLVSSILYSFGAFKANTIGLAVIEFSSLFGGNKSQVTSVGILSVIEDDFTDNTP